MAPALASQCDLRAPLVAIEDSAIDDLYVELVTTFDFKCHTCSNLVVEKVISATHIYKNSDGLLFKESSNFHCLGQQQIDLIYDLGMIVEAHVAFVGIGRKGGGSRDGNKGSRKVDLILDYKTPEGDL
ncbi:hypothetical protein B296_00005943 [Ensete ventricosum]|uniref:Uncharacterized protein n=1 Tax=Ensete ventricosum TaxID=4639 RepID=A0A426XFW5_ENSVE|nr:hypothetical protein B296_00005943 [Ensete ventricosum]